ncbi:MAG: peptidoglycan-binding domain-containing protein [Alphaproteobacteria bacterium]
MIALRLAGRAAGIVLVLGVLNGAAHAACPRVADEMAREYLVGVQQALQIHGYRPGNTAGKLDGATQGAIRQYQRDARLSIDGCPSQDLLDHLNFALPKVYAKGTTPERALILEIQQGLKNRGYYKGTIDGKAGAGTKAAIQRFQADANIPVDGVADQALRDALQSAPDTVRAP